MMVLHLTEGETDFIWHHQNRKYANAPEPTTLIVFQQNERGFAAFQAAMGIIGTKEPVCSIFNKLFDVSCFNSAPEPSFPEWRLYETYNSDGKRVWLLRLTNTHPIPKMNHQDNTWLYTYPVVRDVLKHLTPRGIDSLVYITANQIQTSLGYEKETYISLYEQQLAIYDYSSERDEVTDQTWTPFTKDLITTAPSWIFCHLFKIFNPKANINELVFCSCSEMEFVDRRARNTLLDYLVDTYKVVIDEDGKEQMDEVENILSDIEGLTQAKILDRLGQNEGGFSNEWV